MLQSYEAIYDHGRLTWTGDAPLPVRARVIVTLIDEQCAAALPDGTGEVPNGTRLAAILTEMPEKGIGKVFGDPMEWQREAREGHDLPGQGVEHLNILSRKPLGEDEIEKIMQKTCGAWGQRTLEETDAMIKQRRLEDWGEDIP